MDCHTCEFNDLVMGAGGAFFVQVIKKQSCGKAHAKASIQLFLFNVNLEWKAARRPKLFYAKKREVCDRFRSKMVVIMDRSEAADRHLSHS